MSDECNYSIFSDDCGSLGGLNAVEHLLYSQILPQLPQPCIQIKRDAEAEAWYISQLIGERVAYERHKASLENEVAKQRKKEFDQHTNETINDWVTEMKEQATAQEKPLPGMNVSPWASETKKHATAQDKQTIYTIGSAPAWSVPPTNCALKEKQPLGALGRACLMFKILTNIDMTEQQAEKFLDLVKVCEGHTND